MVRRVLAGLCAALLIAGCGESKQPGKTVFDPLLQTKQKARDVETKLHDSAQRRSEQLQEDEQNKEKKE